MYQVWWSDQSGNWYPSHSVSLDQARFLFNFFDGERGQAQVKDLETGELVDIQLLMCEEELVNWQKEGF